MESITTKPCGESNCAELIKKLYNSDNGSHFICIFYSCVIHYTHTHTHTHTHTSYVHTNKLLLVSRYFNSLGIGAADEWGKSINKFIVNHDLTYSTTIQYVVERLL